MIPTISQLIPQIITSESFQPYGQLITPIIDNQPYSLADAQLDLSQGLPRFYLMTLRYQDKRFHYITRHNHCTQCLGSLDGKTWYLAVAPPSGAKKPDIEQLKAFQIPGDCFIKLDVGTWHSGPYFDDPVVNFYNLELSDTNVNDHVCYDFREQEQVEFQICDRTTATLG